MYYDKQGPSSSLKVKGWKEKNNTISVGCWMRWVSTEALDQPRRRPPSSTKRKPPMVHGLSCFPHTLN